MTTEQAAAAYAAFWESISPASLSELERYIAPNARFRDPFNDVTGIDGWRRVLAKMFEDVSEPRFTVLRTACDGDVCYLRWTFHFRGKRGGPEQRIEGVSEVRFDGDGRVAEHVDHWDAASQIYEGLPVVGQVLRAIRRRLST